MSEQRVETYEGGYQAGCDASRDRIAELEAAIGEIDAEHQPDWATPKAKAQGKPPWVCLMCGTADGSWPCVTQAIVDEVMDDR